MLKTSKILEMLNVKAPVSVEKKIDDSIVAEKDPFGYRFGEKYGNAQRYKQPSVVVKDEHSVRFKL